MARLTAHGTTVPLIVRQPGRGAGTPSQAFDTDAAYGHTGSGTINMIMKTGPTYSWLRL